MRDFFDVVKEVRSLDPSLLRPKMEAETHARLYRVFLIMRSESWRAAEPAWITPTQAAILNVILASRGPVCIADIARELQCSRQTVSRSVVNLEYKCYVERKPCRWDRRKTVVKTGAAGRLAAEWARKWDARLQSTVRTLPLSQLDGLSRGLDSTDRITRRVDRQKRRR